MGTCFNSGIDNLELRVTASSPEVSELSVKPGERERSKMAE